MADVFTPHLIIKMTFSFVQQKLIRLKFLDRIEGNKYIEIKKVHNEYLKLNPFVAKKKFINLYLILYF